MSYLSRRQFLENSMLAAATAAAANFAPTNAHAAAKEPAKRVSANDRIRVACIGVNGQGGAHISNLLQIPEVELVAICDVDPAAFGKQKKQFEKKKVRVPDYVQDIRKLLERKDIDVVTTATPNHWHALVGIWAMQAGKDVYVEKPVCHNISEGRRLVDTARKLGRICQMGSQSRSMTGMRQTLDYIHSGKIGKVDLAKGFCYKPRGSIGKSTGACTPPSGVDVDLWFGPAQKIALTRQKFHYDWHWFWAFGNGDLGNQGIHEMDKARWGLGKKELPKRAFSVGGRVGYIDDGETANTQVCIFEWDDAKLIFEVRGLKTTPFCSDKLPEGLTAHVGNIWRGSEGYVVSTNYQSGTAFDTNGKQIVHFNGGSYVHHFQNFLEAVRSRKPADLHADVEDGHYSSALCHLGNMSYRSGTMKPATTPLSELPLEKEELASVQGCLTHLKANGIVLDKTELHVGLPLVIDQATESTNSEAANKLLTREYRKGFEVPASA